MGKGERRMRIAIIGYSACGKSTLAEHLGRLSSGSVLHLDQVHWLPGWNAREPEEERRIVEKFLDQHDSWVIEGNYSNLSYDRRMEEADRIIFMNFNRFSCLFRAAKRYLENRGKSRPSMAEGCPEKLDGEFVWWILYKGRRRTIQNRYRSVEKRYRGKIVVIRDQRELTRYTESGRI